MEQLLEKYYNFLIQENKKYNLTAITQKEEVYIKHFEDSLKTSEAIDFNDITSLCDVGSGAGFPSIPLKLKYPHLRLVIVEPNGKKSKFLNQLVFELGLKDVIIINDRVEVLTHLRDSFDCVTARAVASLPILLELCMPLVKINGVFIALKGNNYQDEIDASNHALKELSSSIEKVVNYNLSKDYGNHSLIVVKKNNKINNKYPRSYALIKKKPL